MTIARTDIRLYKPERTTDNADGGGRQTANEIVDGVLNNLFTDSSRLDRTTGRVSLRKGFVQVDTENNDTLLGAHAILTHPADDPGINVCMFRTGSPTDERADARDRVEAYVIAGPELPLTLYGTHISGTQLIRMTCRTEVASPELGSVLLLSTEQTGYAADQQYIRVDQINSRVSTTFSDGAGDYIRDVIVLTASAALRVDFYGLDTPARYSSTKAPTRIRDTQVADASRYFAVKPLEAVAEPGDTMVTVSSPYVHLVPTNSAETALVDQLPYVDSAALVPSGPDDGLSVSGSTAGTTAPEYDLTLFFGTSYKRGSLRITRGSTLLKDNSAGDIVALTPAGETDGYAGVADYQAGSFTLTRTSSWSGSVSATATAAGVFVAQPHSRETLITLGNRGYNYTESCIPLPAPGAVTVSYRALGRWYTLRDNGAGTIFGNAGEGSGSINYATGSLAITLGALPDVDSSVLITWGTPKETDARYGDSAIDAPVVYHTLGYPPEPGTLEVTFLAGGVLKTCTSNTAGVISGDASGLVNHATGDLWIRTGKIPDSNTTFTFNYDRSVSVSVSPTGSVTGFVISGSIGNSGEMMPGTITMTIPVERKVGSVVFSTTQVGVVDDGAGGWINYSVDGAALVGTVDYTTGAFSITLGTAWTERRATYTYEAIQPYGWVRQTFTGFENVTTSETPVAGPIATKYRLATESSTAEEEEIDGPPLVFDLTPYIRDTVISGSARFTIGGRTYVDRAGALYYDINPLTNSGTLGGSIALSGGIVTLTDYAGGGGNNTLTINSLLTVQGESAINTAFFRVPVQELKLGSMAVRANRVDTGALITGTSDLDGDITGTGIIGTVDAEQGIVRVSFGELVTAAGNESEPWYVADAVVSGQIRRPIAVDPSSLRYNCVALKSVPIDADIIQLDPVRLPVDGRVPWIRPGNVAVIHHTDTLTVASPSANDVSDVGRENCTYIYVRDSAGVPVLSIWYDIDLDAGTVTWSDPLDLAAYDLPILIEHRVEDMRTVSDVLITGEVTFTHPLTHDYPSGSYLSTALIPVPQDLTSLVSNVFAQTTWSGEWSDVLIGDEPSANYNTLAYPIVVRNDGAMTGRYRIQFTSVTAFRCFLEDVGGIGDGVISADFSPTNPLTGLPYFTIDKDGWGSGWASGNLLRFNIAGAGYPIWFARCTLQGPLTEPDDSVTVELRGDAD